MSRRGIARTASHVGFARAGRSPRAPGGCDTRFHLWFNFPRPLRTLRLLSHTTGPDGAITVELPTLDLDQIPDAAPRRAVQLLLNLLEQLHAQLQALQAENQRLRDEIRRLTGQ